MNDYVIYAIKAIRKPVYIGSGAALRASDIADPLYDSYVLWNRAKIAVNGVSVQAFHAKDKEAIDAIEIGGTHLNGIEPLYQCGGY